LLDQCEEIVQTDLLPIVEEEPGLRSGSFTNLLEEYAEAKLFYAWLYGDTTQVPEMTPGQPPARLLQWDEFEPLELTTVEYLGGLCDLTGEVGRVGVHKATARDKEGIKLCLATNRSILTALQMMERIPQELGKKMDVLKRSVEKLERILYELSLSEAAGGRDVQTTSTMDIEPDES
jgi:predicted translin family RNA/ssDNA-binding protein